MNLKRKRIIQRHGGILTDHQMDIYFHDENIECRSNTMLNEIVQDLSKGSGRESAMFDCQKALSEIEVLPSKNIENKNIPGISVKLFSENARNNSITELFHFHPFSGHDLNLGNWNLFVQNDDTGILAIDAMIRLVLFPGFICFDVEDVFSVFHSGNAIAFELDHFTYGNLQSIIEDNPFFKSGFTRYLAISPTQRYKNVEQFLAFEEEVRLKYNITGKDDLMFASYFAPSESNRAVVFAGIV